MTTLIFKPLHHFIFTPKMNVIGICRNGNIEFPTLHYQYCRHMKTGAQFARLVRCMSTQKDGTDETEDSLQELRVPNHWLEPSKATEESEWLRVTLHKWLDDEYCPELTNVEISKVAANSFYKSLMEKQTDLGDILLKMAVELESISYQESFHGAFSSANAAVSLIVQRILEE